jgi:hypothetical protein
MVWREQMPNSALIPIAAGVAAGIAVIGVMEAYARFISPGSPWDSTLESLLTSLSPLVPGLVAGYFSSRSAFLVGAVASAITSILWSAYAAWAGSTPAIPDALTYAVIALIVGGVCGIAGAAISRKKQRER